MNLFTFLPVAVTLPVAFLLGRVGLSLHPAWTARILVTIAATATLSVAGTALFVGVNYAATLAPDAANRLPEWMLFGDDEPVPAVAGVPAMLAFGYTCAVTARVIGRNAVAVRRARRLNRGVLESDVPLALAVPGRRGGVLVSRGLLHSLTGPELAIVFRHEQSHLRHAHHRYLLVAGLTAAVTPLLRPLAARLRLALERWADEDTAQATGDRILVARTIAKVSLAAASSGPPQPRDLAGFAQSQTVERVRALLAAPPTPTPVTGPLALVGSGLTTGPLAAAALQLDQALGLSYL
ncbi:M56 family metallopeptidase [Spirillospora sp. NPDC049652]